LNAAKAAVTGVVQATFGRALWIWRNTSASPSAMLADVQPNATTSRCIEGRISAAAGAIRSRMARSVSGVMSASLNSLAW